jgi:hypothetical protein
MAQLAAPRVLGPQRYTSCPRRTTVGVPAATTGLQGTQRSAHPDRYPVRHIHDYSHQLFACSFFSKIDLVRAYNQIPVYPDDIQKTDMTIPFGVFEFHFMSFGLRNAAQMFQRFMDDVLRALDFCFAYLDDILVFSRSLEKYERYVRAFFDRLQTTVSY